MTAEQVHLPPTLHELGWEPIKGERGCYRHTSGATIGRRSHLDEERGALVYEARVNGGPWEEVTERFHETLDRALSGWTGVAPNHGEPVQMELFA